MHIDFPQIFFVLTVGVNIKQNLVMTVCCGGSVSMTALLHSSGLLSSDSLLADLQHHQYVTVVLYLQPSVGSVEEVAA